MKINTNPNIKTVCVTGGPCSGKSSAEVYLERELSNKGVHTIFVPESATILMESGMKPGVNISIDNFQIKVLEHSIKAYQEALVLAEKYLAERGPDDPRYYNAYLARLDVNVQDLLVS